MVVAGEIRTRLVEYGGGLTDCFATPKADGSRDWD